MTDRLYLFELRIAGREVLGPFKAPSAEGFVIGRSDEASDYVPDIDLGPFSAREHGVSRRHAAIVAYRERPHIIDLNSVNGSFLNGRKLVPGEPHPLANGDELRLGTLVLHVTVAHMPENI